MLYLEVVVQGRCSFLSSHVLAATFEVLASWLCFILWCTWHNALLTYSFSFRVLNAHHPLELNFYWLVSSCHFTHQFCLGRMASTILSFSRAYSLEPKYCMLQCRVLLIFLAWFSCLLPHASVLSCRQQLISLIVHSPHRLMSAAHGCCLQLTAAV